MIGNFNEEAQTVLMNAKKEMLDLGHPYIGTEHLLLSILNTDSNITERLNNYDLYYDNFNILLASSQYLLSSINFILSFIAHSEGAFTTTANSSS